MYLFLGCQQSILVDGRGAPTGKGTPRRCSGRHFAVQELSARDLPSRVAAIFAPDDVRQTALVFLSGDSGTVAPHHQLSTGT
jgi:hypothetical protein